jgi:uridylate kinase
MSPYRRILLKFSGEILLGKKDCGISLEAAEFLAKSITEVQQAGIEIGIVIGGGNLFRGIQHATWGLERVPADQMGILATLINGIALQQMLQKQGCRVRAMTPFATPFFETYNWEKALTALSQGEVLLFVGGTGHPFFSTDTSAALRASELKADLLLKATTWVDGVYECDPRSNPQAKKYSRISYEEVLLKQLKIVDLTAVALCMETNIPIRICNFFQKKLLEALADQTYGTLISTSE